jgi:hypothetical protein
MAKNKLSLSSLALSSIVECVQCLPKEVLNGPTGTCPTSLIEIMAVSVLSFGPVSRVSMTGTAREKMKPSGS